MSWRSFAEDLSPKSQSFSSDFIILVWKVNAEIMRDWCRWMFSSVY